jgi:aminoglycoside phosphotransferase (APT) family kinase protein
MIDTGDRMPDEAVRDFIRRAGLAQEGDEVRFTALTGGVSSDIWLVEAGGRRFCVKRALPRLRVAAEWRAPVERSIYETAWLRGVAAVLPSAVPVVLADDPDAGMLAMEYLSPEDHRSWKADLLAGRSDVEVAAQVGRRLGCIHSAFARDPQAPRRFPRTDIFRSIRLEPYLEATARAHPRLGPQLMALSERTAATRLSVVHGDVSPKNILLGPAGPVFLDAECAWFGDPAVDPAFCLNHLLLKCLAAPSATPANLEAYDALAEAYLAEVDWEDRSELEERCASLLPALLLARVDGKSPVEYITTERDREVVRLTAAPLIARAPDRLADVRGAWARRLQERGA